MIHPDRFKRLREKYSLTQRELGKMVGRNDRYIAAIEKGKMPGIALYIVEDFLEIFGVSFEYLSLKNKDRKPPKLPAVIKQAPEIPPPATPHSALTFDPQDRPPKWTQEDEDKFLEEMET